MLSRFHLIPERHERTDGRTDGRTDRIAINIARQCADARKTTALGMIVLAHELHRTSSISRRCQRLNRLQSLCIAVLLQSFLPCPNSIYSILLWILVQLVVWYLLWIVNKQKAKLHGFDVLSICCTSCIQQIYNKVEFGQQAIVDVFVVITSSDVFRETIRYVSITFVGIQLHISNGLKLMTTKSGQAGTLRHFADRFCHARQFVC